MKPRKGVDAEVLLKYGTHTQQCASREYIENQHGGIHANAGKPCNCGWDKLQRAFQEDNRNAK